MIKNDTILSTTDDSFTLLQWLKKVEDALKNASATAVKGVPQADGKVVFEIDFADGTSIKSDPFELPEKLPEGYAVDDAGNVTIAGALTANNNGNVDVDGKELCIDGRKARIRSYKNGVWDAVVLDIKNSAGSYIPALRLHREDTNGVEAYVLGDNLYLGDNSPVRLTVARSGSTDSFDIGMYSEDGTPGYNSAFHISWSDGGVPRVEVAGTLLATENYVQAGLQNAFSIVDSTYSKARYQHTVHITSFGDANKQLNVSFTARSSKSTPVSSYQDLHEVFGGRNLTLSGLIKYWAMGVPIYLDLHGGTISTDKLYFVDASSAGAYQQPALSEFPNIAFTDDVVPD